MTKAAEEPYIMIPNITVQKIKSDEQIQSSYVELYGRKTVMYLRQLLELKNVNDYSQFSINMILWMSNIQTNLQRERKYFKQFLVALKVKSLIECLENIDNITADGFLKMKMNIYKRNDNGQKQNYFKLMHSEYNTIMDDYSGNLDKFNLLNLFCNLKSRMWRNAIDTLPADRQPEVCFPSYESIKDNIGIESDKSLKGYIDTLVDLNLIRYGCAGDLTRETGKQMIRRNSNFIYTLFTEGWEADLKESIITYKNIKMSEGWVILTKSKQISANEKRSITQKINLLEKAAKASTITQFQKKELSKLKQEKDKWLSSTNINVRKLGELKLIEAHPNKPLSNKYDEVGYAAKSEIYTQELLTTAK